jgi:hypothetical protein
VTASTRNCSKTSRSSAPSANPTHPCQASARGERAKIRCLPCGRSEQFRDQRSQIQSKDKQPPNPARAPTRHAMALLLLFEAKWN